MNIGLWINARKYQMNFDAGWYSDENFTLMKVELFTKLDAALYVIYLQIAKFAFCLYFAEV